MERPVNSHCLARKRLLPLSRSHKVIQTCVPKRESLQSHWWKWCRLEWRSWWGKINHWLFPKLVFSGGAVSCQTKKHKNGSLMWIRKLWFGCWRSGREATFLRSPLREMAYQQMQATVIGWNSQSCIKLAANTVMHKKSKHIDTKMSIIKKKSQWQLSWACVHTNWSTGSRSVDKSLHSNQSWATSTTNTRSIVDSTSHWRKNKSGVVEEHNSVKILELQSLNFIIAQIKDNSI